MSDTSQYLSSTEQAIDTLSKQCEEDQMNPERVGIRDRLKHFTWIWFAATMATGALSSLLAVTPNRFAGLDTIGSIFFILDLVLFVTFNVLIIIRFTLVPSKLLASLHHPVEGLFFGTYFVSTGLIINNIQLYAVPHCGPWLITALEILFWMYCAIVLLVAIFQYYLFFQDERLQVMDAVPAWIFPIYPILLIGPLAGNLLKSQPLRASYPMWVGAVMLQGLAWTVALMMYSIYTQRLMTSSLPSPPVRPGMYVSVGPAGYTAAGLISLGLIAPTALPPNIFGITSFRVDEFAEVVGILAGTFILLFAFWFCCITTLAVIFGFKEMTFTLTWWAFVFPNVGMALGVYQLGRAYSSPGINGVCSALTIMLVILWIIVAICHVRAVWQGVILWPGKDEDQVTTPPDVRPKAE